MKNLKIKFNKIKDQNPTSSDICCFGKLVKSKNYDQLTIRYNFLKLVDKDEYDNSEQTKEELFNFYYKLSLKT